MILYGYILHILINVLIFSTTIPFLNLYNSCRSDFNFRGTMLSDCVKKLPKLKHKNVGVRIHNYLKEKIIVRDFLKSKTIFQKSLYLFLKV